MDAARNRQNFLAVPTRLPRARIFSPGALIKGRDDPADIHR